MLRRPAGSARGRSSRIIASYWSRLRRPPRPQSSYRFPLPPPMPNPARMPRLSPASLFSFDRRWSIFLRPLSCFCFATRTPISGGQNLAAGSPSAHLSRSRPARLTGRDAGADAGAGSQSRTLASRPRRPDASWSVTAGSPITRRSSTAGSPLGIRPTGGARVSTERPAGHRRHHRGAAIFNSPAAGRRTFRRAALVSAIERSLRLQEHLEPQGRSHRGDGLLRAIVCDHGCQTTGFDCGQT
jgi:hypothetical protein